MMVKSVRGLREEGDESQTHRLSIRREMAPRVEARSFASSSVKAAREGMWRLIKTSLHQDRFFTARRRGSKNSLKRNDHRLKRPTGPKRHDGNKVLAREDDPRVLISAQVLGELGGGVVEQEGGLAVGAVERRERRGSAQRGCERDGDVQKGSVGDWVLRVSVIALRLEDRSRPSRDVGEGPGLFEGERGVSNSL